MVNAVVYILGPFFVAMMTFAMVWTLTTALIWFGILAVAVVVIVRRNERKTHYALDDRKILSAEEFERKVKEYTERVKK